MPTLAEIRNQVDAALVPIWGRIQTFQAAYLLAHGRYWQGIRNPVVLPADGAEQSLDNSVKPIGQAENWADANLSLPVSLPMSIEIHTHDGPQGKGYTGIVMVKVGADRYYRMQGIGAHSVTVPWTKVLDEQH